MPFHISRTSTGKKNSVPCEWSLTATELRFSSGKSEDNIHTVWCNEENYKKHSWSSLWTSRQGGCIPAQLPMGPLTSCYAGRGVQLPTGLRVLGSRLSYTYDNPNLIQTAWHWEACFSCPLPETMLLSQACLLRRDIQGWMRVLLWTETWGSPLCGMMADGRTCSSPVNPGPPSSPFPSKVPAHKPACLKSCNLF